MGGLLLPLLLLVGGYIYYAKLGGKEQLDSILGELKGGLSGKGGGGDGFSSSSGFEDLKNGRTGKWTDENNNNFNVESDVRTKSNVSGGASVGSVNEKLRKMGVFYTIPRFGNL